MRRWLARLVDAEVRQLHIEMAHVRKTRHQALTTALDEHLEVLRLRARVQELEQLLLNPTKEKSE